MQKKVIFKKINPCLFIFFCVLFYFFLFLFKNPFSERNLLANFEPFPDTFQYVNPALSLARGEGMKLVREGRALEPNVAPFYSLVLMPVFLIKDDPRMFYFINITLAILSFSLFFLLIRKITQNIWTIGFISLIYVTNYYIYWFPTLAMAENLILTLFLTNLLLLHGNLNDKKAILAGAVSMGFLATKYSALPLTFGFLSIFLLKIFPTKKEAKKKNKTFFLFLGGVFFSLLLFYIYEKYQGINIFQVFNNFLQAASPFKDENAAILKALTPSTKEGFSNLNFNNNLLRYLSYLAGKPVALLWNTTPILPAYLSLLGLLGLSLACLKKEFRQISFSLMFILLISILFMSTFSPVDARYIYYAIPILLIGCTFFLSLAGEWLEKKNRKRVFSVLITGLLILYALTNGPRLYRQAGVNLKGVETPWYYVSVQVLNDYLTGDKILNDKKPIVVTSLPPYLVDYYSNGNYTLLPLSKDQDFRHNMEKVWGPNDYSDLLKLYERNLKDGYNLYIGGFGIENQAVYKKDFDRIKENFKVTKAADGCYNLCNVYKVEER